MHKHVTRTKGYFQNVDWHEKAPSYEGAFTFEFKPCAEAVTP